MVTGSGKLRGAGFGAGSLRLAATALLAALAGCRPPPCEPTRAAWPPAPIEPATAGVTPSRDTRDLSAALSAALSDRNRDRAHGLIDPYAARIRAREPLDRQLARFAVTGPRATPSLYPDEPSRLAYWANARAGWALKLALAADMPDALPPAALERRGFRLDGRMMTLEAIDAELAAFGWLAVAAAPGVRLQRARLPEAPFTPDDVRRRLAERLDVFIADERRIVADPVARRLSFPPVLWACREDLLSACRQADGTDDGDAPGGSGGAPRTTFITALLRHTRRRGHYRLQDMLGYTPTAAEPSRTLAVAHWP
ncbi:MAG: hypothetical protein KGY99_06660 [Phycisphaerae bacterium]|nr:hypothetical protein [Phycisphaerae bacterium]